MLKKIRQNLIYIFIVLIFFLIGTLIQQHFNFTLFPNNNNENKTMIKKEIEQPEIRVINNYTKKLKNDGLQNLPSKDQLKGYGIRVFDNDGNITQSLSPNKDKTISCFVSLGNMTDIKNKSGLLIFIDGIIQDFNVDDKLVDNKPYMYEIQPYSLLNIPIKLNNIVVEDRPLHEMSFVFLDSLQEEPSFDKVSSLFYTTSIKVKLENFECCNYNFHKSSEIIESREKIIEKEKITDDFLITVNKKSSNINLFTQSNLQYSLNDSIDLSINAFCKKVSIFKTYIFIDNKLLGKEYEYIRWKSNSNYALNVTKNINLNPGKHIVYTLTCPENINEVGKNVIESRKIILEIK